MRDSLLHTHQRKSFHRLDIAGWLACLANHTFLGGLRILQSSHSTSWGGLGCCRHTVSCGWQRIFPVSRSQAKLYLQNLLKVVHEHNKCATLQDEADKAGAWLRATLSTFGCCTEASLLTAVHQNHLHQSRIWCQTPQQSELHDASFACGSESASYSVRAMVPFSAAFRCKFAEGDWDGNLGRKAWKGS